MDRMTRKEYDELPLGEKPWPGRNRVIPGQGMTEEERYEDGIEACFRINVHNLLSGTWVYTSEKDPDVLRKQAEEIREWFYERGWEWCDIHVFIGRYGWMRPAFRIWSKKKEEV